MSSPIINRHTVQASEELVMFALCCHEEGVIVQVSFSSLSEWDVLINLTALKIAVCVRRQSGGWEYQPKGQQRRINRSGSFT